MPSNDKSTWVYPNQVPVVKQPERLTLVIQVSSGAHESGNFARITINDVPVEVEMNEHNHDRGLHIVLINSSNGQVQLAKVFDTYRTSDAFDAFIAEGLPEESIVVAACKDDCVRSLS